MNEASTNSDGDRAAALERVQEALGYRFRDLAQLEHALTHASALDEGLLRVAERLEFLGDAVVDLAVTELLIESYPEADEGVLSRFRANLVDMQALAAVAARIGLGGAIRLGKGEERSGGRGKLSILEHAFEATLGAVFLDGGYEAAREIVKRHFAEVIATVVERGGRDAKTELQEHCHREHQTVPNYSVVEELGPDHARTFVVEVSLDGAVLARGIGRSKRAAEQAAARAALDRGGDAD